MKKNIEQHLKEYFSDVHLSATQFEALDRLVEEKINVKPSRPLFSRRNIMLGVASVSVAAVFFIGMLSYLSSSLSLQDIADEVAYNHAKNLESEILTDSYATIQSTLHRLDFAVISSEKIVSLGFKVLGARYCSIQSKTAAQIKLFHPDMISPATLYQVPAIPGLGLDSKEHILQSRGYRIKIWEENGLLLALAESSHE